MSSARARAVMPRRSMPPIGACRCRWWTPSRTRAASVCIADASRRRRCCTLRKCSRRRITRRRGGSASARRRSTSTRCRAFKNKVVTQLTGGVGQVGRMRKINYIQGRAAFRDARTLDITRTDRDARSTRCLRARDHRNRFEAVDDSGVDHRQPARRWTPRARSTCPTCPSRCSSSAAGTSAWSSERVYAALGSKVTVVEMTDGLLPGADRDLVNVLAKRVKRSAKRCCSRPRSSASRTSRTASA